MISWLYSMNIEQFFFVLGITFNALKCQLLKGIRLEDPLHAPEPISKLCRNCWIENSEDRPPFYNIIDYIRHNFEITKYLFSSNTKNKQLEEPNMYSITYAKLNFQELKLRKQFDDIRKSLKQSSSISSTIASQPRNSNTISNNDMGPKEKIGKDNTGSFENGTSNMDAYRRIDPVKSRALMSLQIELELANLIPSQGVYDTVHLYECVKIN